MKPTAFSRLLRTGSPAAYLLATAIAALLAAHPASAATFTWTPTAAGTYNWDNSGPQVNWTSGFPNALDDIANLNIDLLGGQTINLNQTITVGTINLGDTGSAYFGTTVAGAGGSLILDVSTGSALISKATAANTAADLISADIKLNDNLVVNNAAASGTLTLSGIISQNSGAKSLTKIGVGNLILNGAAANTFTGGLIIKAGTLTEDFANLTVPTNLLDPANALTLGGGTLSLIGQNNVASLQTFASTALSANRASTITLARTGTGTMTVALGAITRNIGSTLNFSATPDTSNIIATTSTLNTNDILGTWATVNSGTNLQYATVSGGQIVNYTGATTTIQPATLSDVNNAAANFAFGTTASPTLTGTITANTLRFTGGTGTLANAGNSITLNGLMNAGTGALTVSGTGSLVIGTNKELVAIFNNQGGTISSKIVDNPAGPSALTLNTAGAVTLSGANIYGGGTTISGSNTVTLNSALALGTGPVTANSGTTLAPGNSIFIPNSLTLNGATLNLATGKWLGPVTLAVDSFIVGGYYRSGFGQYEISGNISGPGGLTTASGNDTPLLSGTNTYTGRTIISTGSIYFKGPASLYNSDASKWTPANISVNSGCTLALMVGGLGEFTGAQAGTLITNLTTGINNNGLKAGSTVLLDPFDANGVPVNVSANITDSTGTGGGQLNLVVGQRDGAANGGFGQLVILSGNNSYSGTTAINRYRNVSVAVSSFNSVATNPGLGTVHSASSSLGAPTTVANGTITFGQGGDTTTIGLIYTGTGETTDRVIQNTSSSGSTVNFNQSGSGLLKFTSAFANQFNIGLQGSTTGTGEIAGAIPAVGTAVSKSGTGTWTLSGTNLYTGTTTISGGLLKVTGSTATGSAVTVSGGALGGTGTVNGTVTLTTGGINLADGAVGNLTLGSTLASTGAAGTANLCFDLGNGTNTTDKIIVGAATSVATTGAAVINLNQIGGVTGTGPAPGPYTLIQGTTSMALATQFALATTKAFGQTFALSVSGNNLQLTTGAGTAGSNTAWSSTAATGLWTTVGNWASGVPGYTSNVTIDTTTQPSQTLGGDFDINSLTFGTTATAAVTIAKGTVTAPQVGLLTIEANGANGITVNTPSLGNPVQTISANVGLASSQTWFVNNGAALTVSGAVTDFGAGNSLTKDGAGTLTLSGTNTYWGATTVSNGKLILSGSNSNASTTTIAGTGILQVGSGSTTGTLSSCAIVDNGSLVFNRSNAFTQDSIISGSGTVTQSGTAATTLSSPLNSYTGNTIVTAGILSANDGGGLPAASFLSLNGGAWQPASTANGGSNSLAAAFTRSLGTSGASTFQFDTGGGGFVANSGQLTINIGGNSTPSELVWGSTVGTNIVGTLQLGSQASTYNAVFQNRIDLNGTTRTVNVITAAANTGEISGVIRNTGGTAAGLIKTGTGILKLSGANTYDGLTTIQAGTVSVASLNNISGGSASSNLGAPSSAANGIIVLSNANTAGTLLYTGMGATTDRQVQVGSGNTTTAGTASIIQNDGIGALTFNNTYLNAQDTTTSGTTATRTLTLQGSNLGNNTITGIIRDNTGAGTNIVNLTKAGTGTWTLLSGSNSYTGTNTISAGMLVIGSSATLGATTNNLTLSGGALDLGGTSQPAGTVTVSGVAAYGDTIKNGSLTGTSYVISNGTAPLNAFISANLLGTGTLTKSGAGYLTLSGANTYSGATAINGGILYATSLNYIISGSLSPNTSSSLGKPTNATNGTIAINGGSLAYTGTGETTDRVINLSGTTSGATIDQAGTNLLKFTAPLTATGNGLKSLTLQGSTAGTGEIAAAIVDSTSATSLTKTGSGTWTLSGSNTYTGATAVSIGTLNLDYSTNNTSKLADAAALTLAGTLNLSGGSHTEIVGSTTLNAGASAVNQTNSGSSILRMQAITRNVGSTINFGTDNIADTNTFNTATGILGGWATVGGANWATSAASGTNIPIAALTSGSYTASGAGDTAPGATANVDFQASNSTAWNTQTINTLRFNTAAANTLTVNSANTLTVGSSGILVTNTVGGNQSKITGGTIAGGVTTVGTPVATSVYASDLVIQQYNTGSDLKIESVIANSTVATPTGVTGTGNSGQKVLTVSSTAGLYVGMPVTGTGIAASSVIASMVPGTSITLNNNTTGALSATALTFPNNVTALTKSGPGALTLTGTNTYTGMTYVNGGTLNIGSATAIPAGTAGGTYGQGTLVFNDGATISNTTGAMLDLSSRSNNQYWNGSFTFVGATNGSKDLYLSNLSQSGNTQITLLSNSTVNVTAGIFNAATHCNGAFSITKTGPGELQIGNSNNVSGFTGGLYVNEGTYTGEGNDNATTYGSGTVYLGDPTPGNSKNAALAYRWGGYSNSASSKAVAANNLIVRAGSTGSLAWIDGTGYGGSGNYYTGNHGLNGTVTLNNNLTVAAVAATTQTTTFAGTVTGTGGLNIGELANVTDLGGTQLRINLGTVILSAANNFTGNTKVNTGTLALANVNALQSSTLDTGTWGLQQVTFTVAGTNTYNLAGLQGSDDLYLGFNSISVGANNADTNYAGNISSAATGGGVTKVGSGNLTLSGANAYAGNTTINSGILTVSNNLAIQNSALDTTTGTGTMTLTVTTPTFGGLTGSTNVASKITSGYSSVTALTLNPVTGATNTYSGVIADGAFGMTLTKSGGGTQILAGANTYTGATAVNGGTLKLTGSLENTAITVGNGGTFAGGPGATAGLTTTAGAGSTLTVGSGGAFTMADNAIGTFNLQQSASFASPGLVASVASGTAPTFTFDITNGNIDHLVVSKAVDTSLGVVGQLFFMPTAGLTSLTPGNYTFLTAASGLGASAFTLGTTSIALSGGTYNLSISNSTATDEILTVTPTGSLYKVWIATYYVGANADASADPDSDGIKNVTEFAFDTLPNSGASGPGALVCTGSTVTAHGQPILVREAGIDYAEFGRRLNRDLAGLTYKVQFSADLVNWETSGVTPTTIGAADATIEVVRVPYPATIFGTQVPKFFRVLVTLAE